MLAAGARHQPTTACHEVIPSHELSADCPLGVIASARVAGRRTKDRAAVARRERFILREERRFTEVVAETLNQAPAQSAA